MGKTRKFIVILALILIIFIAYKEWFFSNSILSYSDWLYNYDETILSYDWLPTAWTDDSLGSINLFNSLYPINIAFKIFTILGVSYNLTQRIIFMIIPIIISGLGIYSLSNYITKNLYSGLISVVVYLFNTYVLLIQTSHLTIFAAFSFAPFYLYSLIKYLKYKKNKFLVLNILIGFIMSIYEFRVFYIFSIYILFFTFFYVQIKKFQLLEKFKNISATVLSIFVIIILNLYWLAPIYFSSSISKNFITTRSLFGNQFLSIEKAALLFHPFWTSNGIIEFSVQKIPIYFVFIPMLAFIGFILNRKNIYILFFASTSLIGIFLTKQVGGPFGNFYELFFKYIPGFSLFREASKFYMIIIMSYSILISSFFSKIYKIKIKKDLKIVFFFLICLIFLINLKPILTGSYKGLHTKRIIHEDYIRFKELLLNEEEFSRTLWIPAKSRWGYYDDNHPRISLSEVFSTSWASFYDDDKDLNENIHSLINMENFQELLNQNSVKYIIVPIRDYENDDDFYRYFENRTKYIKILEQKNFLKKISFDDLIVFENISFHPHIFFSDGSENIISNIRKINASKYTFQISILDENLNSSFALNFAEEYHPDWKVVSDELDTKSHTKTKYNTNEFLLTGQNQNISAFLIFYPQNYSIVFLVLSIFVLGYLSILLLLLLIYEK